MGKTSKAEGFSVKKKVFVQGGCSENEREEASGASWSCWPWIQAKSAPHWGQKLYLLLRKASELQLLNPRATTPRGPGRREEGEHFRLKVRWNNCKPPLVQHPPPCRVKLPGPAVPGMRHFHANWCQKPRNQGFLTPRLDA